jgi:hypothetical protein
VGGAGPSAAPPGAPQRAAAAIGRGLGTAPGAIALLALLAVACCSPLLVPGWHANHEQLRPIARIFGAWQAMADGDLYPRWIPIAYGGKGVAVFDFYPPAYTFLAAWLHLAGVPLILSAKLVLYGLFLAGAAGTFLWVRRPLGHAAGLVAAVLYLFAPYHFLDVYLRGAVAEFASLAPLPFLFLAIDLAVERAAGALAALALSSAAVVVSHFLGALTIAPFAAIYALARAVQAGSGRAAGRVAAGALLGAALSAFYWLPALAERGALSAERLAGTTEGYQSPFHQFVHPLLLLDPTWKFGGAVPDSTESGMSYQLGLLLLAAGVASAIAARRLARGERRFVVLALALGAGALALTTSASAPFYRFLPVFQLVQFPFRFLGPATLLVAAGGAGFARALADRRAGLGPLAAAAVSALALALSAGQRAVAYQLPLPDDRASIEATVRADDWATTFGTHDEYRPDGVSPEAAARPTGGVPWGLGVAISSVRARSGEVTFDAMGSLERGIVVVPWHWFPGWTARVDGRPVDCGPGPDGLISLWVGPGHHSVRVRFETTPPRVAGWLLAVAGLATLGALGAARAWRRRGEPEAPGAQGSVGG